MQRPSPPRRGSRWSSVAGASVALVPPRSSVLPPGAGNEEAKKAVKPGKERAKQSREGIRPGSRSRTGTVTRRPSVVTTTATAALAISEEAQATDSHWPAGSGSAQSKRPRRGRATRPGPDDRHVARCAAHPPIRAKTKRPPVTAVSSRWDEGTWPDHHVQRCPASIPKSGRERAGLVTTTTAMGCDPDRRHLRSPVPAHACADGQGHGREQRHSPGEARQVRLHVDSFEPVWMASRPRQPGGLARKIPGFASPPRDGFALDESRWRSSEPSCRNARVARSRSGSPRGTARSSVGGRFRGAPGAGSLGGRRHARPPRRAQRRRAAGRAHRDHDHARRSPAPISTSPTLNTLANGSQRGQGEDVGQEPQRRVGRHGAVRVAASGGRRARPSARSRPAGRHRAAVGDDRHQVARAHRRRRSACPACARCAARRPPTSSVDAT